MSFRFVLAPLAFCALAGCNTWYDHNGSKDPGFGEAIKYDMAVQTIDPDPVYTENSAQPGAAGDKAAAAVKRYRTDAVKAVTQESSRSSGGGGGAN